MDHNYADDVQNVDKDASDAVTDCLGNSVVLRRILEHFSSAELRQLSLVNKLWKYEARSVMRKRGELIAYIKFDGYDEYHPQKEVEAFISDLKLMNPIPFSGISIDLRILCSLNPVPIPALDLDYLQDLVFDQSTLKTVSVKLRGPWLANMGCPGVLLAKKILQDSSAFLEELELHFDDDQKYVMEKFVQDSAFPSLQILKLKGIDVLLDDAGYENYMKVILSRAPNLKVLHSCGSINVLLRVLEGSSVTPVYEHLQSPFEWISENAMRAIKLEKITLE